MAVKNFNTQNDSYKKIMADTATYIIPHFQRDYSWAEDEWEDLWNDILGILEESDSIHYMGYLVLQTAPNDRTLNVIDGQQRLTTLSLFVIAAMKNLQNLLDDGIETEKTKQRLEQLRNTYIGYLNPVTLVAQPRLKLNRNNNSYYQDYIVPMRSPLPTRGFKSSEHLLRKSFTWFDKRISDYCKGKADKGMAIAELVEIMSERLLFTVITVTDELNAYTVFETLNSRGVRLSATDLLKNYLFSTLSKKVGEHEINDFENRWEAIIGRLGSESFPDFLRMHWNSRNTFVRQSELYKRIRSSIPTEKEVFELIRNMEEDLDTFINLTQPENSDWGKDPCYNAKLLKMFSVRQPISLLLAAKQTYNNEDFFKLLKTCMVISFRYNVIGNLPANEQERVYNNVAYKIISQRKNINEVFIALKDIYPTDDAFKTSFSEKIIKTNNSRNKRIVRYILSAQEERLSGLPIDHEDESISIEHILPEKPAQNWDQFSDSEYQASLYRIGNMTFLKTSENGDLGNAPWSTKLTRFKDSKYQLSQKIADEFLEWNFDSVQKRQKWMAKQATAIWRVDQLS